MSNQEFLPREALDRALARWWVVVFVTVLGGIVGWAFHFLQSPVYEATAVITIDMDFTEQKLTQYEEDHAFNAAGALIKSAGVKNKVITEAQARNYPIDSSQLQQQMFTEVRQSVWELHVRDEDPQVAAELANIWAEKADAVLNKALEHAIAVDQIQSRIDAETNSQSGAESQATLTDLSNELVQEKKSSNGILSIMSFSITSLAAIPEMPTLYGLGNLVLAGACVGFVISIWGVNSYKVKRRG